MKEINKRVLLCILLALMVLMLVIVLILNSKRKNSNNLENSISVIDANSSNTNQDIETIEKIKNETYASADNDMYEVHEEYDGRKILQIKPSIQYKTVLAGILKNGKLDESEIDKILKDRPKKSGIWISKQSRQNFLKLLDDNSIMGYKISDDGYLVQNNGNNATINKAIESDKLYIIDMSGKCYDRDNMSGKIVEYPFEDMEPDQTLELYSIENSSILEITTNSKKILSNKEILDDILLNIEV